MRAHSEDQLTLQEGHPGDPWAWGQVQGQLQEGMTPFPSSPWVVPSLPPSWTPSTKTYTCGIAWALGIMLPALGLIVMKY